MVPGRPVERPAIFFQGPAPNKNRGHPFGCVRGIEEPGTQGFIVPAGFGGRDPAKADDHRADRLSSPTRRAQVITAEKGRSSAYSNPDTVLRD